MRSGLSKKIILQRDGYKLHFHPSALTAALWVNPKERRHEEAFLRSLVQEGDTIIDIGANIGNIGLCLSTAVGAAGKVYAYEPHPQVFQYLAENIRLNCSEHRIVPRCIALGNQSGRVYFSDNSDDSGNNIVADGTLSVPIEKLDDMPEKEAIALIKIDVEGYEYQVLQGAAETCQRASLIYLECIPSLLAKNNTREEDICNLLYSYGFEVHHVEAGRLQPNIIGSHKKKMILAKKIAQKTV